MNIDLGRLSSGVLTEVRTVLSRARTALDSLENNPHLVLESAQPIRDEEGGFVGWTEPVTVKHPDIEEMIAVLSFTVDKLSKWKRTGAIRYQEGNLRDLD